MFTPQKDTPAPTLTTPNEYVVYGWQRSYFTHKLMAALHFYGAPWRFEAKTAENEGEIRYRSGTHQIPVLHTPENWMIGDTTPLLRMLDVRYPDRALFPRGVLGALTHLVEEYFDEWIARTTVHWRWNYPENHQLLALDAAYGDEEKAAAMVIWGGKVCRATGVDSPTQQREAENEYHRIMAAVQAQLRRTPYLLGERPTAVDCIFLAGLRAHFLYDPAPKAALYERYPEVVAWVEHGADKWTGSGELPELSQSTDFARFVLQEMATTYKPFVLGNRQALEQGDRAFVIPMYGEDVSYLARPYIEQSRGMLAAHVHQELSGDEREAFLQWLQPFELSEVLTA